MVGNKDSDTCPLMSTLGVVDGKWKASIIWYLGELGGVAVRYGKLKAAFPYSVSHKVFTEQLRALERDGIVSRREYDEMPPRVEYSLTSMGDAFLQLLRALRDWGVIYGDYSGKELGRSHGVRRGNGIAYFSGKAGAPDQSGKRVPEFLVFVQYGDSIAQAKMNAWAMEGESAGADARGEQHAANA